MSDFSAETHRWTPFPTDTLPAALRHFVETVARSIGCDHSFVALPALTACATAIGNSHQIELKVGWSELPIVWSAIIGESGTAKSPAMRAALKPLHDLQTHLQEEQERAEQRYRQRLHEHRRDLQRWKRQERNGEPPREPTRPPDARVIVSDATIAAIAPLLRDNPRGLCLHQDELAGWLGSFDRRSRMGGGDLPHWLSMHSGEPMIIDRMRAAQPTIHVPRANLSIIGGIQPGTLRRALHRQHREAGLAARLVLAMPPRRSRQWTESGILPASEANYALLLESLRGLLPLSASEGEEPVRLRLDAEARRLFIEFFNQNAAEQAELTGELAAAWSKLEAYAPRLALIFHLVRQVSSEDALELIDSESMASAIALTRWFAQEARRVCGLFDDANRASTLTDQVISLIEKRGGRITANDLRRRSRAFNSTDAAERFLTELAEAGEGLWEHSEPGATGRPATWFVLDSASPGHVSESPSNHG